jgi:riboflavin kinase/FMN adenylyltransferase
MKQIDINKPITNQVVYASIGAFDGVHIGHQNLIRSLVHQAKIKNAETAIITFHPHPVVVLKALPMPFYITSPDEKKHILHLMGIDHVLSLQFNKEMAEFSPEHFMDLILDQYPIKEFWLGVDFALGKNRAGSIPKLREIGNQKGFTINEEMHLKDNGEKVSSSKIRNWITSGDIPQTNKALNRYYSIEGKITHGDSRGRKLGFPTANLDVWEGKLIPNPGVYATWIEIGDKVYSSVTNIGVRPTFENQSTHNRIETYIHDFDQDIYQNQVKLHFVEKTRSEKKFESVDQLINQITSDAKQAEEILRNVTKPSGLFT